MEVIWEVIHRNVKRKVKGITQSRGRRSRADADTWDISTRGDKKELLELEMSHPTQKKVAEASTFISLHKYN